MQFHQTAVVFIIVYFLIHLKYTTSNFLIIFTGSIFTMFFADKIVGIANDVFDKNYTDAVDAGGVVATSIYVLIIGTAFMFNKKLHNNGNTTKLLYVVLLGGICYIMRYFGARVAERISFYFMFSQLGLLPSTLKSLQIEESSFVRTMVIFLSVALFIYRLYGSDLVPYRFYW